MEATNHQERGQGLTTNIGGNSGIGVGKGVKIPDGYKALYCYMYLSAAPKGYVYLRVGVKLKDGTTIPWWYESWRCPEDYHGNTGGFPYFTYSTKKDPCILTQLTEEQIQNIDEVYVIEGASNGGAAYIGKVFVTKYEWNDI